MAKKKAAPPPSPEPAKSQLSIINLKGSTEQAAWLEAINRKTHIPKSMIVRLGLVELAERMSWPPFPMGEEGDK